jgi:CHAT domain-containing protein
MKFASYLIAAVALSLPFVGLVAPSPAKAQTNSAARPASSQPPQDPLIEAQIKVVYDLLAAGDVFETMRLADIGLADGERLGNLRLEERMILAKAASLRRQSKPVEAESFLRLRLASDKWKVGTNQRAGIALSLAGALLEQGRIQDGASMLETEKETFLADAVPASTKSNYYGVLGAALVGLKQFEGAELAMLSYAQIAETSLGTSNPRVAEAWEAAGASAEFNKRENVAFERYRRAVDLAEPLVPVGSMQLARHQMNYGRMAIAMNQPELARQTAQKALDGQYLLWRQGFGVPRNITPLEQRIFVTSTDVILKAELMQNGSLAARRNPLIVNRVFEQIQRASWAGRALAAEEIAEVLAQRTPALAEKLAQVRASQDQVSGDQILKTIEPAVAGLQANFVSIEAAQSRLSKQGAILAIYDGVDETHIVLITKQNSEWRTLAVPRNAMCARIARLRSSIAPTSPLACSDEDAEKFSVATSVVGVGANSVARTPFDRRAAYAIYQDTIGVFASALRGIKRLEILPLGSYGAVPWAALPTRPPLGRDDDLAAVSQTAWAIKSFEIVLVSSLSTRPSPKVDALERSVLAFGSDEAQARPNSPQSSEITTLIGLGAPTTSHTYWGPTQSHEQFEAPIKRSVTALVFSAHGLVVETGARRDPGIVLSLDSGQANQILNSTDIAGSNLWSKLVILAGCDLAVTNGQPSGDAFGPLVSAFGARGVRVILAPIAPLTDLNSLNFTRLVLRDFLDGQENVALSLRQSQLDWLRQNRRSNLQDPSYWAVFTAIIP